MKRILTRVIVALAIFCVGAAVATGWFVLRERRARRSENNPVLLNNAASTATQPPEEYFQVGRDERSLGIRHYVRPRSAYSGILGRLSEFVSLKGRTKKNTFYISKIERDEKYCDGSSDDTCSFAYVFWKENNSILILYPPFDREDETYFEWTYSMRRIDLTKDVVPTWKDAGTTNHLIPKSEARSLLKTCLTSGIKTVIERSS